MLKELSSFEEAARQHDPIMGFRALGYPTDPIEIELADWRRCGFDPGLGDTGSLIHAGRLGHIELLVIDSRSSPGDLIRRYRSFSKGIRPLVATSDKSSLSLWTWASGAPRKLRIDPDNCTSDQKARLLSLRPHEDAGSSLEGRIERAFSPGDLEKEFLDRFRRVWVDAADEIESFPGVDRQSAESQALLILSRFLFLTYIQLKGWLDRDRMFLSRRAHELDESSRKIYQRFISPLFFGCLNTTAQKRNASARSMGKIPYLNGGLFARSSFELEHRSVSLSNKLVIEAIDECFDRFSFTISETDDDEVAIDPEMLGRVFEALMNPEERGRTGSFYTPKRVVEAMIEDSLCSWLSGGDGAIERLLRKSPRSLDATVASKLRGRLRNIRVVDPSCGSGAFLMSALRKIEELSEHLGSVTGQKAFSRRSIVERSLHGVDLKPEAVTLCELRLWLAIVAGDNSKAPGQIKPLPQLDRNILQGNSLLSDLDTLGDDPMLSSRWSRSRQRHQDLVGSYRNASDSDRAALRRELRRSDQRLMSTLIQLSVDREKERVERLRSQQKTMFGVNASSRRDLDDARTRLREKKRLLRRIERGELDYFSWKVNFAHLDSCFDLVVGNPPWVRSTRLDTATRRMLSDRYATTKGGGRGVRQFDLSTVFVEKSLSLLSKEGRVAMLVPSKILSSDYAIPLRKQILASHTIVSIHDLSHDRNLFEADTFPVALLIAEGKDTTSRTTISRGKGEMFDVSLNRDGSPWILVRPALQQVLDDLQQRRPPLEKVLRRRPLMGLKTGANSNFFVELAGFDGPWATLTSGERIPADRLARCIRGRDVRRWRCHSSTWMIWPPSLQSSEEKWLEEFLGNRNLKPADLQFSYMVPEHLGLKVAWKDVSAGMQAVVLPDVVSCSGNLFPLVPNQTLYLIDVASMDEGYAIAGMLNSTIGNLLTSIGADQAKDGHRRYFARTVASIPMFEPAVDQPDVRDVIRLARSAQIGSNDTASPELDRAVARCMGLSSRELGIIERATRDFVG